MCCSVLTMSVATGLGSKPLWVYCTNIYQLGSDAWQVAVKLSCIESSLTMYACSHACVRTVLLLHTCVYLLRRTCLMLYVLIPPLYFIRLYLSMRWKLM